MNGSTSETRTLQLTRLENKRAAPDKAFAVLVSCVASGHFPRPMLLQMSELVFYSPPPSQYQALFLRTAAELLGLRFLYTDVRH